MKRGRLYRMQICFMHIIWAGFRIPLFLLQASVCTCLCVTGDLPKDRWLPLKGPLVQQLPGSYHAQPHTAFCGNAKLWLLLPMVYTLIYRGMPLALCCTEEALNSVQAGLSETEYRVLQEPQKSMWISVKLVSCLHDLWGVGRNKMTFFFIQNGKV